jgi:hypothetical protein
VEFCKPAFPELDRDARKELAKKAIADAENPQYHLYCEAYDLV